MVKILFLLLFALIAGCTSVLPTEQNTQDLLLTNLEHFNITNNGCTHDVYQTVSLTQYSFCNYSVSHLNNTEIIIEVSKITNASDLIGSYQYSSSHLIKSEWRIQDNTFGEMSSFQGWEDNGYYYYHLWIVKDSFLIHITSKGSEDVNSIIPEVGERMVSKVN